MSDADRLRTWHGAIIQAIEKHPPEPGSPDEARLGTLLVLADALLAAVEYHEARDTWNSPSLLADEIEDANDDMVAARERYEAAKAALLGDEDE